MHPSPSIISFTQLWLVSIACSTFAVSFRLLSSFVPRCFLLWLPSLSLYHRIHFLLSYPSLSYPYSSHSYSSHRNVRDQFGSRARAE